MAGNHPYNHFSVSRFKKTIATIEGLLSHPDDERREEIEILEAISRNCGHRFCVQYEDLGGIPAGCYVDLPDFDHLLILLDKSLNAPERRFYVVKEAAHALFNTGYVSPVSGINIKMLSVLNKGIIAMRKSFPAEHLALVFAAEILMPSSVLSVRRCLHANRKNPGFLANRFLVPTWAVEMRNNSGFPFL